MSDIMATKIMATKRVVVDPKLPDPGIIAEAAVLLKKGDIVAFPTETVYGLGAVAFNENAVEKIFAAKERPAGNPLIVHIGKVEEGFDLVAEWPEEASLLARTFWPGPLTLVLPASDKVPGIVRGGGNTVGMRMPAHGVALALIEMAGPLAAPSANRSGRPSPRTADEVWEDLEGRIPMIVDAGPTPGGIESTVLDLSVRPARILRPGGIARQTLEQVLGGAVEMAEDASPSSGLPHYQTRVKVQVVTSEGLPSLIPLLGEKRWGMVANDGQIGEKAKPTKIYSLVGGGDIFSVLRQAEKDGMDALIIVKDAGLPWDEALENRIRRAAEG